MGPFAHFPMSGKITYPARDSLPDFRPALPWFDHWLKGVDNGITDEPVVRYFLMGDPFDEEAPGNEWRTAARWPPPAETVSYYLDAAGVLRSDRPSTAGVDSYTYDPRDPVPTVGGNNLFLPRGPLDQRKVGERQDVLEYLTPPLEQPVQVVGRVKAELFVSTDAPDTDFVAKLVDVYPDGYEALVLDQPFRLRYRDGLDDPRRAEKGTVYRIDMNLWTTALVFNRGHRIALHVTSSNAPRFEPHSNTWEPVLDFDAEARVARNGIHRGVEHASRLLLPIVHEADSPQVSQRSLEDEPTSSTAE